MSTTAGKSLPVGPVLWVTTSTQALTTFGAFALAAAAPRAAADLGVSSALIGYQVAILYLGASTLALAAGGIVRRYGPVRTSQIALWLVAAGCALSAAGNLLAIVGGALVMGLGYGATNPAASQLLARVPTKRMNLIFSIKQTGVPLGGVLSGVIVPPITQLAGWQAALLASGLLVAILGVAIGVKRIEWDTDPAPGAPLVAAMKESAQVVWRHPILRWLAASSFLYSGVQLSLMGFLVAYLVSDVGLELVVAGTVLSLTHAAGAIGRISWGLLADRVRSGAVALVANGVLSICGATLIAAIAPTWSLPAIIAACSLFGFAALGWNGVFIAAIARRAPAGTIGHATGGSLFVTYAGVIVTPPAFAALHDKFAMTYGSVFGLLAIVTLLGIGCVGMAWRARIRLDAG